MEEKDKIEYTDTINFVETSEPDIVAKELDRLNEQLAEKEQENERLNLEFETQEDWQEKWQKLYDETCNLTQDKISFAVEQLEQLRHDIWTNQADDGYTDMQVDLYELNDVIDVRIMQIKEGK